MGEMSLSPRVSVCRSRRQHCGQGSCLYLVMKDLRSKVGSRVDGVLSPAGQSLRQLMPREIRVAWSSTLVCGARLSQQWSGTCLSCTLKVGYYTLLGLSDKCLVTPGAKWGIFSRAYGWDMAVVLDSPAGKCRISPGAHLWVVLLCRQGCSDHMCRYLWCVSLSDVSVLT